MLFNVKEEHPKSLKNISKNWQIARTCAHVVKCSKFSNTTKSYSHAFVETFYI